MFFKSNVCQAAHAFKSSQPLPFSQPPPSIITTSPYELFLLVECGGPGCGGAILRTDDTLLCTGADKVSDIEFMSQLEGAHPLLTRDKCFHF
jgi:hypothetical protein